MIKEIMESKAWDKGDEIYKPSRVVLLKHVKTNGKVHEYSTHIQCQNEEFALLGRLELYYGQYFCSVEDAKKDFNKREV